MPRCLLSSHIDFYWIFMVPCSRWCHRRCWLLRFPHEKILNHRFWWLVPFWSFSSEYFRVWYPYEVYCDCACTWGLEWLPGQLMSTLRRRTVRCIFKLGWGRYFPNHSIPSPWKSSHHLQMFEPTSQGLDVLGFPWGLFPVSGTSWGPASSRIASCRCISPNIVRPHMKVWRPRTPTHSAPSLVS